MLGGKMRRNPKDENSKNSWNLWYVSWFLKGRADGLEEITSLLREYELTEADKNKIIKNFKGFIKYK